MFPLDGSSPVGPGDDPAGVEPAAGAREGRGDAQRNPGGVGSDGQSRVVAADDDLGGDRQDEFVDRALRQAVTRESNKLQSGMTLLATVGATAPFVGLLGTVWGIYGALIKIGATGSASIDAVAGPVGEALIMTAIGLFVAIPAVFAYNFFSKTNAAVIAKFDTFAHDLHDFFATGSRVR